MATRESTTFDVTQRVRQTVDALLRSGAGSPDIHAVAAAMGTSIRTLQRRLHEAGSTYVGVLREARFHAAQRMLLDRRLRIGAIARILGYSDHGHFTRAFQSWSGSTPRAFRDHRATPDDSGPRPD